MRFKQETLATIRRRIGHLLYGTRFIYGQITATDVNTFTILEAAKYAEDHFVGRVAHFLDTGEQLSISASENGSGEITVNPAFAAQPDVATYVEVWSEDIGIAEVNNAINTALMEAQDLNPVKAREVIDAADFEDQSNGNTTIPLDADWTHVSSVAWYIGDTIERPTPVADRGRLDPYTTWPQFAIEGHDLIFNMEIPASVEEAFVEGYRLPALLDTDTDLAEVRSDFLVYRAASLLQMDQLGTVANDPDSHNARSTGWAAFAENVRRQMKARWDSNTATLE